MVSLGQNVDCVVIVVVVVVVVQTMLYDMCVSPYTPTSMHLIRVAEHLVWRWSTLARCLCTGPTNNYEGASSRMKRSTHRTRRSPSRRHWELARPAQQGRRTPNRRKKLVNLYDQRDHVESLCVTTGMSTTSIDTTIFSTSRNCGRTTVTSTTCR